MIEYKKVDGSFDLSGKSAVVVGGGEKRRECRDR